MRYEEESVNKKKKKERASERHNKKRVNWKGSKWTSELESFVWMSFEGRVWQAIWAKQTHAARGRKWWVTSNYDGEQLGPVFDLFGSVFRRRFERVIRFDGVGIGDFFALKSFNTLSQTVFKAIVFKRSADCARLTQFGCDCRHFRSHCLPEMNWLYTIGRMSATTDSDGFGQNECCRWAQCQWQMSFRCSTKLDQKGEKRKKGTKEEQESGTKGVTDKRKRKRMRRKSS